MSTDKSIGIIAGRKLAGRIRDQFDRIADLMMQGMTMTEAKAKVMNDEYAAMDKATAASNAARRGKLTDEEWGKERADKWAGMTKRQRRADPHFLAVPRVAATAGERVAKSRAKSISSGARRVEVILRDASAIRSLDQLVDEHGSVAAAVTAALKR